MRQARDETAHAARGVAKHVMERGLDAVEEIGARLIGPAPGIGHGDDDPDDPGGPDGQR